MNRTSVLAVEAYNGKPARKEIDWTWKSKRECENCSKTPKSSVHPRLKGRKLREGSSSKSVECSKFAQNNFADEWNKNWFNQECSRIYGAKSYSITSLEEQKELLRKYRYDKCKSLKSKTESITSDGRYKVILNNRVTCLALCDYGADYSAMPWSLLFQHSNYTGYIEVMTLSTPNEFQLVVCDEKAAASAPKKVSTFRTNMRAESGLYVWLRGVEFLVMDQNMSEVFFGRPFLPIFRFKFEAQLALGRTMTNNKSVGGVC